MAECLWKINSFLSSRDLRHSDGDCGPVTWQQKKAYIVATAASNLNVWISVQSITSHKHNIHTFSAKWSSGIGMFDS